LRSAWAEFFSTGKKIKECIPLWLLMPTASNDNSTLRSAKELPKALAISQERAQVISMVRSTCAVFSVRCSSSSYHAMLTAIVSLPELIAQTNMDHQSVNRLREELSKLTNWLGRNALIYFVNEYETPGQEYTEKAKNL
jgi:MRG